MTSIPHTQGEDTNKAKEMVSEQCNNLCEVHMKPPFRFTLQVLLFPAVGSLPVNSKEGQCIVSTGQAVTQRTGREDVCSEAIKGSK